MLRLHVSFAKPWLIVLLCPLLLLGNTPVLATTQDTVEELEVAEWSVPGEGWTSANDFYCDCGSPQYKRSAEETPFPVPVADVTTESLSQEQLTDSSHAQTIFLDTTKADRTTSDIKQSHASHCDPEVSASLESKPDFSTAPRKLELSLGAGSKGTITISPEPMQKNDVLKVSIRPSPEYDFDTALNKRIIVCFSEPMVSTAETFKSTVSQTPMTITPSVAGSYKWLDRQTLIFTAEKFFPRATEYKISISKNTKSITGKRLLKDECLTFSTARPEPRPGETSYEGQMLLSISFDQKIKIESLLPRLSAANKDGKPIGLRMINEKEIKQIYGDRHANPGTNLAFYPIGNKQGEMVTFTVQPGVQSVEGPLLSKEKRAVKFATTSRSNSLTINRKSDETKPSVLEPGQPIFIPMTQQLEPSSLRQDSISASPKIENMKIYHKSWAFVLSGDTKPDTIYNLTVKAGIESTNKKKLEKDETISVKVGSLKPRLIPPASMHARMNPSVSTSFPIQSVNIDKLKISVFENEPTAPMSHSLFYWNYDLQKKPIFETVVDTNAPKNELATTNVDLKQLVNGQQKDLVVVVEDPTANKKDQHRDGLTDTRACHRYATWIEITSMCLSVIHVPNSLQCFLTDASTGQPVEGATVIGLRVSMDPTKYPRKTNPAKSVSAVTDKNGLCVIPLPVSKSEHEVYLNCSVIAKKGDNKTSVPTEFRYFKEESQDHVWTSSLETYEILRDRPVRFSGWVKPVQDWKIQPTISDKCKIHYSYFDQQKQLLGEGDCSVTSNGGFEGSIVLPSKTACGQGMVQLNLRDQSDKVLSKSELQFNVAEQIPHERDLSVCIDKSYATTGEDICAWVLSKDSSGQPKQNEEIRWQTFTTRGHHTPPGWSGFVFDRDDAIFWGNWKWTKPVSTKTNADGRAALKIRVNKVDGDSPVLLAAEITTGPAERPRKDGTQSARCLIHAPLYAGLKVNRSVAADKQDLDVTTIVTKPDGTPVTGKNVEIRISEAQPIDQYNRRLPGKLLTALQLVSESTPKTSKITLDSCKPLHIEATVLVDGKIAHRASVVRGMSTESVSSTEAARMTVVPDKDKYNVGDKCLLHITSPFPDAHGVVALSAGGNSIIKPFYATNHTAVVEVIIDEKFHEKTTGIVKLYESKPQATNGAARSAIGFIELLVGTQPVLSVDIAPQQNKVTCGKQTSFAITTRNPDGTPASDSEVVVSMIPEENFYDLSQSQSLFENVDNRSRVGRSYSKDKLASLESLRFTSLKDQLKTMSHGGTSCGLGGNGGPTCNLAVDTKILNRSVSQILKTDSNGKALVSLPVPALAGDYNISCRAVCGNLSGSTFTKIAAVDPLSVNFKAPTEVFEGDEYSAAIEIHNGDDKPAQLDLTVHSGEQSLIAQKIQAPPGVSSIRLATANVFPQLSIGVDSGQRKWSFKCDPSVRDRYTVSSQLYFGTASQFKDKTVVLQETENSRVADVNLEIFDGRFIFIKSVLDRMVAQQNNSTIQTASRALALLSFYKMCKRIGKLELASEYEPILREDVCLLSKAASARHGWMSWLPTGEYPGGKKVWTAPYMTAYALYVANEEGFAVDQNVMQAMCEAAERQDYNFYDMNPKERMEYKKLRCFSLFLSALYSGQDEWRPVNTAASMEHYLQGFLIDRFSDEELGWLTLAAQKVPVCNSIKEHLSKRLDSYVEQRLSNETVTNATMGDAVNLLALISSNSSANKSDKVARLANRVERNGERGTWSSPIETAFAVISLCQLIDSTTSTQTVASLPLHPDGEKPFPMLGGNRAQRLGKDSELGLFCRYAHRLTSDQSTNRGIAIRRDFKPGDKNSKLWQDKRGDWHTTAGSTIEGKVTIVPTERTDFILLAEYIAAGLGSCETVFDPTNLSEGPTEYDPKPQWEIYDIWPQQIDTKGNTIKVYATAVGPRLYEFKYKVNAVCPGKYFVPPATINTIFDNSKSGTTSSTTFYVHAPGEQTQ